MTDFFRMAFWSIFDQVSCLCMRVCRLQYFVLVVVIFVLEIVAGVLAFVFRHDIEKKLYQELVDGIRKHYPQDSQPDPEGLRATWGFLQSEVRIDQSS